MKNLIYLMVSILIISSSCSKEEINDSDSFKNDSGTFTDQRDNHTYKWVRIGDQIWMAENLAYNSGSNCWAYDNNEGNAITFGRLYNYDAAKTVSPDGWHLPSENEWQKLIDYVLQNKSDCEIYYKSDGTINSFTNVGYHLRSKGILSNNSGHWIDIQSGYDSYGFNALPGGMCASDENYSFGAKGLRGIFHVVNANPDNFNRISTINVTDEVKFHPMPKQSGYSIRCVKD